MNLQTADADEEEDPVSWEGNVQDHVKAFRNRGRQFEAGCMTICDDLMEERNKSCGTQHELSAARVNVSHLKRTRKSQGFPLYQANTAKAIELTTVYTGIDVVCIEFLLHLVTGDSAKESRRHTVLLDTSNFDGHDSRGRKRRLTPEDELCY